MSLWHVAELELRRIPPAKARVQDFFLLPDARSPTVVVLRLNDDPSLRQMHAVLRGLASSLGLRVERRPFLAHLTLARVLGMASPDLGTRIQMAIPPRVMERAGEGNLDRVCLYRSDATPAGQHYGVLGSVQLRDGAA